VELMVILWIIRDDTFENHLRDDKKCCMSYSTFGQEEVHQALKTD
jgi:hypothetical protein